VQLACFSYEKSKGTKTSILTLWVWDSTSDQNRVWPSNGTNQVWQEPKIQQTWLNHD